MRLDEVLAGAPAGAGALEITGLAYDNRAVEPGALFFCVPGFTRDGHDFAPDAVARGAVALVVDHRLADLDVAQIEVSDVRAAMAPAAAAFYGDPTASLQTVGITGTNGKTTTAFLVRALLEAADRPTGLLGTVKSVVGGVEHEVQRTTPEAIDLQRTFREMLDHGDRACAMEVSSHALALHRADAIHFAAAIFTNLTQDHLDFHPTMEAYFEAKRMLFAPQAPAASIVNIDDPYGARLARDLDRPITVALHGDADYRATELTSNISGSTFTVQSPDGPLKLSSPLRGEFNVYNVLGALAAARTLGVPPATCVEAISNAGQVPGRFETVDAGQPFAVVVDYAHTPDSLENVLRAARELTAQQLIAVFGCGGDRDRAKRPMMGEIASRLADRVIVTSDNPRSENPDTIVEEILAGAAPGAEHEVDRRRAIAQAIESARPGDVVVIAGKGHEQGQEFDHGFKIPFDDVSVVREILGVAAAGAGASGR